jgi:hypothetical protein
VSVGGKQFYTAAELAALGLPGLSRAKRKINERAAAERWALRADDKGAPFARPRVGRGGGLEYHIQLLPASARLELAKRGLLEEEGSSAGPRRIARPRRILGVVRGPVDGGQSRSQPPAARGRSRRGV